MKSIKIALSNIIMKDLPSYIIELRGFVTPQRYGISTDFAFEGTNFTKGRISKATGTSKLRLIKRSINFITGRIPTELGRCSAMGDLNLSYNKLTGTCVLCPAWYTCTMVYE